MSLNDMEIIKSFEDTIANYAGSTYGVAVSSGTNAIFLSLLYLKEIGELDMGDIVTIPARTYMSVPMSLLNVGLRIQFKDIRWSGCYQLKPSRVHDSAVRFTKGMYIKDSLYCLSFQYRKALPIGRGGMILTDSKQAYDWLCSARFNGRTPGTTQATDNFKIRGWNMYMMPEQAARGLTLYSVFISDNKDEGKDIAMYRDYPDISNQEIFR